MKKYILISLIFFAVCSSISAQDNYNVNATSKSTSVVHSMWNIDYAMGFPIGDVKDFIDKPSYNGFYMDGRKFINQNLSVGGGFGWNVLHKSYDRDTYYFDGGAITGSKWDYFFFMPFFVNVHYYTLHDLPIKPFVGLNTGAYYTEYEVQMGNYAVLDKSWRFGLTPEIGFYLPFGASRWALNVKAKYNYVFYDRNNIGGLQLFGVNVGFSFIP